MQTLADWLARKKKGPAPKRPLKRGGRVRRVSKRRAIQFGYYRGLRKVYMAEHETCEFPGCIAKAQELHHKKRRLGAMLNKTRHFMAICSPHHRWLHDNPKEAKALGLLE